MFLVDLLSGYRKHHSRILLHNYHIDRMRYLTQVNIIYKYIMQPKTKYQEYVERCYKQYEQIMHNEGIDWKPKRIHRIIVAYPNISVGITLLKADYYLR